MALIINDIEKVCRMCLREDDGNCKMISIYERQELIETIRECVQIEVFSRGDEPSNICASCILSLNSWSKFKVLCDSTNAYLQQHLQDKNESDVALMSEMTNLGSFGFTPSQMSDFSISFFDSDSLWNNMLPQWNEVEPLCTDPAPRCIKKVQPPEEYSDATLNVLNKEDNNHTKTHWWNPKAISMKTMQKENEKPNHKKGTSKSINKYNQYARKSYNCSICPEVFTKFNILISHDSTVHADIPKTFNCEKCGKLFISKDRLEVHKMVHREKLFECHLCQKKFTLQKTLDIHLNIHIGSYTCKKCGFKAQTMYNLKNHESSHSFHKDYYCKECEKSYSTFSSLRRHDRLVHEKIYMFRCDQCDYSTIQPSNLKYHKSTVHTLQKFICDHCGSSFKLEDSLIRHKKRHTNVNLKCTHCNKIFKKKSSLREHLSQIHKLGPVIKKHKCDVCEKLFMRKRNLQNHKNKFHCTT